MKKLIFVFFTLICFKANSAESINDWSDYANEDIATHNYEIKGIGLSTKITNNTLVGLSYSETSLVLDYPDTDFLESVQLDSLRLRFGYLF